MSTAIRFHEHGGPEVLRVEDLDPGRPEPGEAQVRHTAIGLNYIDVYDRTGLYAGELPSGLGREAAGVITALGRKVRGLKPGDRVAYVHSKPGAYCEVRNVPAERLVKVPRGISDEEAAALMLKGLTAQYLLRRTYRVARGDAILVHAAAGGVGLLLCQWAKALGAKVIGVVGSDAKAELARRNGCKHVLILGRDALAPEVRKLTKGEGVAVVYDSVGKDTFMDSLDCLRPLGMMVTYGNASGPVPAVSPLELSKRGLALPDTTHALHLHCHPTGAGCGGAGALRGGQEPRGARQDRTAICAHGRGPGSSGPRGPSHDRRDGIGALTKPRGWPRTKSPGAICNVERVGA